MYRVNQLLAVLIATILSMSVLTSINMSAITFSAFAEEHEDEEDDDNSGSGGGSDDKSEESEDDSNSGHGSGGSDKSKDERDDEHDEAEDESEESESEHDSEDHDDEKIKLEAEDDGVEIEVEKHLDLQNGFYNVTFSCTSPSVSKSFEDGLEVEDGEGDFEAHVELAAGTYSGCEVTVDESEMMLASFRNFTVSQDDHDEGSENEDDSGEERRHHERIKEHRQERADNAQDRVDRIKERIANATAASPGPVMPGLNYTLIAAGATDEETAQDVDVSFELLSWKSTPAVAILAVVGGEVEMGDTDYTVLIGYAIYSLRHDAVRVSALAVDEASGDVVKITLRGGAEGDVEFPDAAGESVDLHFEGSSGPQKNRIADADLTLDGTLEVA